MQIVKKIRHKYYFDNITFDSKPEIELYKELKQNNVNFEVQVKYPKPYYVDGKEHWTFIDFYIKDTNTWIEVKGPHFFDENLCPRFPYTKGTHADFLAKNWQEKFKFLMKENINIYIYKKKGLVILS
jgi:hypothetical protein